MPIYPIGSDVDNVGRSPEFAHEDGASSGRSDDNFGAAPQTVFDLDFRLGTPAGVTLARTGDAMMGMAGAATAASYAANVVIKEDRAGLGLLPCVFPAFTNLVPAFDQSASPFATSGTVTRSTPGGLVGPDGVTPANRWLDNDAGAQASIYYYTGAAGVFAHQWWVKNGASPSAFPGGVLLYPVTPIAGTVAGASSIAEFLGAAAWARGSDGGVSLLSGYHPAGLRKLTGHDFPRIGDIDLWGTQVVAGMPHDVPLVYGNGAAGANTGAQTCQLPTTVRTEDMDLEVSFLSQQMNMQSGSDPFDFFSILTAVGGADRLSYAAGVISLKVKGGGSAVSSVPLDAFPKNHVVTARAWYDTTNSQKGIRIAVGGVVGALTEVAAAVTDTALDAATDAYAGSNAGTSNHFVGHPIRVRRRVAGVSKLFAPEFLLIGDSTTAAYQYRHNSGVGIYTPAEALSRPGIASTAVVGDKIAQQKAAYLASTYYGAPTILAIRLMIGVNDILAGTVAATVLAGIQDLVNTIHTGNPTAKIVLGLMLPAGSGSGGLSYLSAPQAAVWVTVNAAIRAGTITSVDRVWTAYSDAMNDGSNNMIVTHNSGDNIHPNPAGALLGGSLTRVEFQALGFL